MGGGVGVQDSSLPQKRKSTEHGLLSLHKQSPWGCHPVQLFSLHATHASPICIQGHR